MNHIASSQLDDGRGERVGCSSLGIAAHHGTLETGLEGQVRCPAIYVGHKGTCGEGTAQHGRSKAFSVIATGTVAAAEGLVQQIILLR